MGLESLVQVTDPLAHNEDVARKKALGVEAEYHYRLLFGQNKLAPTLGVENLFFIENPSLAEDYFKLIGSFRTDNYGVCEEPIKIMQSDARSNCFFWWRAYTLIQIARALNIRNTPEIKYRISTTALAALCNCTSSSVNLITKELSRANKHPSLFLRVTQDRSLPYAHGANVYVLTENNADDYIDLIADAFDRPNSSLGEYTLWLSDTIEEKASHLGWKITAEPTSKAGNLFQIRLLHATPAQEIALREEYLDQFITARSKR